MFEVMHQKVVCHNVLCVCVRACVRVCACYVYVSVYLHLPQSIDIAS